MTTPNWEQRLRNTGLWKLCEDVFNLEQRRQILDYFSQELAQAKAEGRMEVAKDFALACAARGIGLPQALDDWDKNVEAIDLALISEIQAWLKTQEEVFADNGEVLPDGWSDYNLALTDISNYLETLK